MKILFDTHAFLWLDGNISKLSQKAKEICDDESNTLILSVASAWEMQIKLQIGKLKLKMPLHEMIASQQKINDVQILSITLHHVYGLAKLPRYHREPFDRLLVAQAEVENTKILSNDPILSKYTDRVIW
ncbi:MAG: type II toxin-antitoxin system VapC family toxin [Bacteroidota bacterium]